MKARFPADLMIWQLAIYAVFAVCVVVAAVGFVLARGALGQLTAGRAFALMSPFLFPLAMIAWGLLFWWPGPEDTEPAWRIEATSYALLLYPGLCAFSIWRSRGCRWLAAALIPLSLFFSLFAAVWAIASVAGD